MKNLTIKDQILNTKIIEELKAIDLTNATFFEKAIAEFIIDVDIFERTDDLADYEIAIAKDIDGDFCVTFSGDGANCTIEGAFDVENWWDEDYSDASKLKETFKNRALNEEYYIEKGVNKDSEVLVLDYETFEKDFEYETAEIAHNGVLSILEATDKSGQKFVGDFYSSYEDVYNDSRIHGRSIVILIEIFDEED